MLRILARISIGMTLIALFSAPAEATPNCLKDHQPYKLAGDTIGWSMTIVPGADCIQGLRWSTMQIYSVSVSEQPKSGELVLVGPGFRYFAKPEFAGTDSFTLVVVAPILLPSRFTALPLQKTRLTVSHLSRKLGLEQPHCIDKRAQLFARPEPLFDLVVS